MDEETVDNTICPYVYEELKQAVEPVGTDATYSIRCVDQMVTVCQPGYEHGVHCKEVHQQTCHNSPRTEKRSQDGKLVGYTPLQQCVNKNINLPRVKCEETDTNVCINIPDVEEMKREEQVCKTVLGSPSCEQVELTLPREGCTEMIYGYTHQH